MKFISNLSQWKMQGYITEVDGDVYVSFIRSVEPGKANFSRFLDMLLEKYHKVKVPCPFPKMEQILRHKGFQLTQEYSKQFNEYVPVWVKMARPVASGKR